MARSKSVCHLVTLAMACSTAAGQPGQRRDRESRTTAPPSSSSSSSPSSSFATSSMPTSYSTSSTTAAPAGFTTAVVPIYLIDIAKSLMTEYFPSTTPYDIAQVSWPSTVVIGTATYGLKAKTAATNSQETSKSTGSTGNHNDSNQKSDERLAIILASIIGFVAIAVAAVLFFFVRRRKQNTGSFFMRRSTPSTSSKGSRTAGALGGHTSYNPNGSGDRLTNGNGPAMAAIASRPGLLHHQSSRSTIDDDPSHSAPDRRGMYPGHQELDGRHYEPTDTEQLQPTRTERSLTSRFPSILRKPVPSRQPVQNPFSSPEDREADDLVSPILPSKGFGQMSPRMVHYPSMSEVSEFDFAGNGSVQSATHGGNGSLWHATSERVDGRHELM